MDEAYVKKGVETIAENNDIFRQISKTISETSDIITDGYNRRNRTDDILIEKEGDKTMGVERVYDPETGEVYEVENGFFDYYKTHRHEYRKNNLEQLPDNNYDLWNEAPLINHGFVLP